MQKWLNKRYESLWGKFQDQPFTFEEAVEELKLKHQDKEEQVNVILSELRKNNCLTVDFAPEDARKRVYKIVPGYGLESMLYSKNGNELTRSDLDNLLKRAADLIRTRVDYSFILLLLFYKRISDKWQSEYEEAYQEAIFNGLSEEEAKLEAKNPVYHDFDIPEELLWESLRNEPAKLPENFSKAMKFVAESNPELRDVFENYDFVQFADNRENADILRQLVELFSNKSLKDVSTDILGDAYEWILKFFAPLKAKEGEVYTAREVIKLLVEILDPKPQESVYDPAMGSGGMLIVSYQHVKNENGKSEADKVHIFGQEVNRKTYALARMNLYIHDIINAQITYGDTLLYPKFKERDEVKKFEVVIANPPWNQDAYGEDTLKKAEFERVRFKYGYTPNQSADWAWIQHMLASANDEKGRVGVVIDNGCLFRGGREKIIREGIIKDDLLEAVLLLPEKLFYNTGAPGAILIFKKNKPENRKGKVLFINASREFVQHPEVRKLNSLSEENIKKIVSAYNGFTEQEGFSRLVSLDEIKENDYNLNVTLYVFPEEKKEEIDVLQEWEEIRNLELELGEVEKKIEDYLTELKEG